MKTLKILIFLLVLSISCKNSEENIVADQELPDGFSIEKLFAPGDYEMGSWVSLTTDNKDRIIASDQYGDLYRFPIPAYGDTLNPANIEKVPLNIGFAQGLLWVDESLYVMVNRYANKTDTLVSGLYRLTDSNNDDQLDTMEMLQMLEGAGEHGPHGLVLGPDGLIYFVAGNHTLIPESFKYIFPDNFGEDNILPVIKDPRGHANHIKAPGGWIARTDLDGTSFEVVAVGFRNTYDIAFNKKGDLFAFDSDMEWDMGSPWYRPIRVLHVIPGADFGWRTGSGKFPVYYPDSWQEVVDIGQGSPTGIMFGTDLNFPSEYQSSLFVLDWSFGTMYSIKMDEMNKTYKGTTNEFLTRKSFPLTDVVAVKGDMFFTIGGRRLSSGLFRVRYEGASEIGELIATKIEKPFNRLDGLKDLDKIWNELASEDRYDRYMARTELEGLEGLDWIDRIETEDNPEIVIQSTIALARVTPSIDVSKFVNKLAEIDISTLSTRQQLELLRAYQLLVIRYGRSEEVDATIIKSLSNHYPSSVPEVTHELLKVLATVGDATVIEKTLDLISNKVATNDDFLKETTLERSEQYGSIISIMKRNNPETRLLAYLESLSVLKNGWTDKSRLEFYTSFHKIFTSTGGMSYKGFAQKILQRSFGEMSEEEQQKWMDISGVDLMNVKNEDLANLPKPEGPGRNWAVEELNDLTAEGFEGDSENGKLMYKASLCSSCHVIQDEGNPVGPDLSTLGSRFSVKDIIRSIVLPNETITDQYGRSEIMLRDTSVVSGRIIATEDDTVSVNVNPFDITNIRKIPEANIVEIRAHSKSSMPPGLLNRLNEKEAKDLLFYLSELR